MSSHNHRIMILDDEPLIAEDLVDLCNSFGYEVCGAAYSSRQAFLMLETCKPSLVLLDINLGEETDGIEIASRLQHEHSIPFIFITSYADRDTLERAKRTSPLGYIVKPFRNEQIYSTIEIAIQQLKHYSQRELDFNVINRRTDQPISEREMEVLACLYQGMDTKGIAQSLFVSVNTVKYHLKNLYGKFDAHNRVELIRKLQEFMMQ